MTEIRFTPLVETNDHEGETWTWWIQVDGNEDILAEIDERIRAVNDVSDCFEEYSLTYWPHGETLGFEQVALLERWSDGGYHRAHNVVAGKLIRSDWWIETGQSTDVYQALDDLYKGGIDNWARVE